MATLISFLQAGIAQFPDHYRAMAASLVGVLAESGMHSEELRKMDL